MHQTHQNRSFDLSAPCCGLGCIIGTILEHLCMRGVYVCVCVCELFRGVCMYSVSSYVRCGGRLCVRDCLVCLCALWDVSVYECLFMI